MPPVALPAHIEGFDLVAGLHRLGGNTVFYASLLGKFRDNYRETPGQIVSALGADNWAGAERLAHSVKGVAATLGADGVQRVAHTLQMAIRNKLPRVQLDQHLTEFTQVLATTVVVLERALGSGDSA